MVILVFPALQVKIVALHPSSIINNLHLLSTATYISSIAIAFGCSLVAYKLHPRHLQLLSFILGLDLFGELAGLYLYSTIKTNLPAYNVILLGEFIGYAYFFYLITKLKWLKKLTAGLMILFPVFWVVAVFILFGFKSWNYFSTQVG